MGEFLEDQNNDKYYYCTKNVRYLKEDILLLIHAYFKESKLQTINFEEIYDYLKDALHVNSVNRQALRTLLNLANNQYAVKLKDVVDIYNNNSENKLNYDSPANSSYKHIIKKDASQEKEEAQYYCTKTQFFPLKKVIFEIYNLYKLKNANSLSFNEVYDYLRNKFNVASFNRANLYKLLNSYGQIPFGIVNELYIETNISDGNNEIYNLSMIKDVFINNHQALKDIIQYLGIEFLDVIIKKGLLPTIDYINDIRCFFDSEAKCIKLNDRRKHKLFDNNNSKLFSELLHMLNENEWLEILSNKEQVNDFVTMFIEDKQIEQQKLSLKKSILFIFDYIHYDNLKAKIKYLFPANLVAILEKNKIFTVSDISNISNKTSIECYEHKDLLLNKLKSLQQSIPFKLNENYKYLIQMVNKDYKPNSLWEQYVAIIEKRADGLTLERSGESFGLTRERVRQLDRKYLEDFTRFYNYHNENLSNTIRAFCDNPLFITNSDINKLFNFNPKIFKYLLKNLETDDLFYIEELDKFYFVDDYDWYKELVEYGENMPEQLTFDQLDLCIKKAISMLSDNDVYIDYNDCRRILIQNYKLLGTLYSKSRLNLAERFKNIIKQFYPNPINIYDDKFLSDFRKHYYDIYKDDKIKTDHAISSIIGRIGMLAGRGEYILNDRMFMSNELANKIYDYILNSGREIFLTNNLFSIFKDELLAEGINNKYFMQGALKQRIGEKLYFRRDYVSTTKEITSIYGEIAKFIKNSQRVVTYDELQNEFTGTPWNVLIFAASQEGILNYRAKYVHFDNLKINEDDIEFLRKCVENFVSDNQIHHVNDLLTYLRLINKQLVARLLIEDQFGLFSILDYLFDDQFEFKRPFVANNGIKIENQYDRLKEFVNSEDEISIDSLVDFAYDNKLNLNSIIEFIDGLDNYIFKDNNSIISLNKTNLNKYNTEIVENMITKVMGSNEFLYAEDLKIYNIMPKEVAWTPWLLYSALNKYGIKLKAIPSDNKFKFKNFYYAKPIIISRDIPAKNLNEYISYLKSKSDLNDTEFYKYLKAKGLA